MAEFAVASSSITTGDTETSVPAAIKEKTENRNEKKVEIGETSEERREGRRQQRRERKRREKMGERREKRAKALDNIEEKQIKREERR